MKLKISVFKRDKAGRALAKTVRASKELKMAREKLLLADKWNLDSRVIAKYRGEVFDKTAAAAEARGAFNKIYDDKLISSLGVDVEEDLSPEDKDVVDDLVDRLSTYRTKGDMTMDTFYHKYGFREPTFDSVRAFAKLEGLI